MADRLSSRALISAAAWMSGSHVAAQLFAYGALIALARMLPPESFGTVAAGTAIVWTGIVFMDAGTHGSIVVSPRLTHRQLRRSFWRCLLVATAMAAAMAIGAGALVGTVVKGGDAAALAVLALSLPLYAVALIPQAVLHRAMEFGKLAQATAVSNAGSAGIAVVVGLAGAGVWALVARQLLWFALLAGLAVVLARPYMPLPGSPQERPDEQPAALSDHRWFLLFGVTLLLAMNLDFLVIGAVDDVAAVGLYALAFLIAFAPVEHFSNQVGKVLFAAAAASDLESSGARTVQSVRLMSILLLPLAPVAVVLAPPVLPALLGSEWEAMVTPFQILLAVGISRAILNCVGETLSGNGEIAFRAKVNVAWCAATLVALVVLVQLDGIRGAALAHAVVTVPYAIAYLTAGARRAGASPGQLWSAVRPVAVAVSWQAAVTAAVTIGLGAAGATEGSAAFAGALTGLMVVVAILTRGYGDPAREAVALLRGAAGSGG